MAFNLDLEQSLTQLGLVLHVVERALHENDTIWELRLETADRSGPQGVAEMEFTEISVQFNLLFMPEPAVYTGITLLANGEPTLAREFPGGPFTQVASDTLDLNWTLALPRLSPVWNP
jgi:hypothetical protein